MVNSSRKACRSCLLCLSPYIVPGNCITVQESADATSVTWWQEDSCAGQVNLSRRAARRWAVSNANQTLRTGKGESRMRLHVRSRMRPKAPV